VISSGLYGGPARGVNAAQVTYGLGLQVAPNSDQVLRGRASEQIQSGGVGDTLDVVHVDVEHG